jgi:mannose-1-phosphate guanylyltransferase
MPIRAAMVLCAGHGTRLRPLTDWRAKPMVPIGDAPAIEHIAARLRAYGVERLVVNVHHRPDDVRAWAAQEGASVSEERDLLGTAGGVEQAAPLLGEGDVIVWNGDILSTVDLGALEKLHQSKEAAGTLAVVPRNPGEGNVGLSADGRVVRLRDKNFASSLGAGEETSGADFIGVHILSAALRKKLPLKGCLVGDVYIPALTEGANLAAHIVTSTFIDIGSVEAYVAANRFWLSQHGLGTSHSWLSVTATVENGATVDASIVGADAIIEADITRCIVWPNSHVTVPMEDTIVTPHGNSAFTSLPS